jgi:hypothetical protein
VRSEKNTPAKGAAVSHDGYSLRDETNAFLANLAQNLSEENEAILNAMRRTMVQLREMSGFAGEENSDGHVIRQPGWDEMSAELDSVLEHMKTILTNPSFVPIEEVVLRDQEIARLKDGWVKMEDRWKDAVLLIDTWRKRMAASGKPVDEHEMMMSLRLSPAKTRKATVADHYANFGLSAVAEEEEESVAYREGSPCPSNPESLHLVPAEAHREYPEDIVDSSAELSAAEDDLAEEDYDVEEPNFEILQESTAPTELNESLNSSPLPEPPQLSPLRDTNTAGNRGVVQNPKLRGLRTKYSTITVDETKQSAPSTEVPRPSAKRPKLSPPRTNAVASEPEEKQRNFSTSSLDEVLLVKTSIDTDPEPSTSLEHLGLKHTPKRGASRLPLPRNADPQQSPLTMATIAAKLAASEKEADAARVRAKLRAARAARTVQKPLPEATRPRQHKVVGEDQNAAADHMKDDAPPDENQQMADDGEEAEQNLRTKPEKRKRERRTSKAASRRRSTLSPLELQSLISGTAQ